MKIEKLERNKRKKIAIGVVIFLCFISVIIYTGSRAKYKTTESIPLVNGTINYKPYDFKMMAMYQANESGGYTEIDTMPTSGYVINEEKSYCTTDGTNKDTTANLYTDDRGKHVFENLKKNDKCYLWFDKITSSQKLKELGLTAMVGPTSFSGVSSSNESQLLSGEDDWGTTYYFRGNVANNWVQFAGFYWRIIRINGDGSIRMIYNGITTEQTGETTQLDQKAGNGLGANRYVGYMYGDIDASTYETAHANINDSGLKTKIDAWYKENIADKGYDSKVSRDVGFCNDRKVITMTGHSGNGVGENVTAYGPYGRTYKQNNSGWNTTQTPTFKCSQISTDLFTTSKSTKGNKKLTYPVGLITMDEILFAGGFGGTGNSNFYLYTNSVYWTMSPARVYTNRDIGGLGRIFQLDSNGTLSDNSVYNEFGIRPVINIAKEIHLLGEGTVTNPYKVV